MYTCALAIYPVLNFCFHFSGEIFFFVITELTAYKASSVIVVSLFSLKRNLGSLQLSCAQQNFLVSSGSHPYTYHHNTAVN